MSRLAKGPPSNGIIEDTVHGHNDSAQCAVRSVSKVVQVQGQGWARARVRVTGLDRIELQRVHCRVLGQWYWGTLSVSYAEAGD